jgi:hypothetical protein
MHLLDWSLTKYDYWTFAFLVVAIVAFFYALIQIGGLPGKIAERRNHPHADAVKLVGWIGLFTVFPWIHAIIWAIHDGMTIDVRSMPKEGTLAEVERTSVLGIDMSRNEGPEEGAGATETVTEETPPTSNKPDQPV